ncbi:uncharacterized protein [Watersipora subatra]|uniref:uncharacterized protein n=1 Tax=Watersipora subatra TaxID=2589382 RepID=UPI00355BFFE9
MGTSTSCIKSNHKDDDGEITPGCLNFRISRSHTCLSRHSNRRHETLPCKGVSMPPPLKGYNLNIRAPAPPRHIPPKRPSDDEDSSLDEQPNSTVPRKDQERYKADAAIAPSVSSTNVLPTHDNKDDSIDELQVQQSIDETLSMLVDNTVEGDIKITNLKKE